MISVFDLRFGLINAFFPEGDTGPNPFEIVVALLIFVALAAIWFLFCFFKLRFGP